MWKWIKNFFSGLFGIFRRFISSVGDILMQKGGALILDIAREAVSELSKTSLKSEQKRQEAFNRIKNYAQAKGIKVASSVIYTMIEMAYQELKERIEK